MKISNLEGPDDISRRNIAFEDRTFSVFGLKSDPYFTHFYFDHAVQSFFTKVIQKIKRPDLISIDVGANIGMTSLALSALSPNGKVYSFEPSPRTYGLLQKNIDENGAHNCDPINMACGSSKGTIEFHDNPNSASASHLSLTGTTLINGNCQVELTTIDDFVAVSNISAIDFIKVDVEGLELEVIKGAKNTISQFLPSLFIEFNSYALVSNGNINPREFISQLRSMFPFVYRLKSDELSLIQTDYDVLSLIYDNMIQNGCLDDLFCTHTPIS